MYCAFAICYMLNDWTAVRIDDALDYLESCLVSLRFPDGSALVSQSVPDPGKLFSCHCNSLTMEHLDKVRGKNPTADLHTAPLPLSPSVGSLRKDSLQNRGGVAH